MLRETPTPGLVTLSIIEDYALRYNVMLYAATGNKSRVFCIIYRTMIEAIYLILRWPHSSVVLYMQRALIMYCFICNVPLLCSALYATCPYYVVLFELPIKIKATFDVS